MLVYFPQSFFCHLNFELNIITLMILRPPTGVPNISIPINLTLGFENTTDCACRKSMFSSLLKCLIWSHLITHLGTPHAIIQFLFYLGNNNVRDLLTTSTAIDPLSVIIITYF